MTTPAVAAARSVIAGEAAGGATAAAGSSAAGSSAAGSSAAKRTAGTPRAGKSPAASRRQGAVPASQRRGRGAPQGGARQPKKSKLTPQFTPFGMGGATKTTQRFLIAEYVTCFALIAGAPIFSRKPRGNALYVANDFVRLSAVSLLFFILALLSSGPRSGRIASAFGALVTLGVVYNSVPAVVAASGVFTQADKAKGNTVTAPEGSSAVTAAVYHPVDLGKNPSVTPGTTATAPAGRSGSGTVQA